MKGYALKRVLINVKNKAVIDLLNYAEAEEVIEIHRMILYPYSLQVVEFVMTVEEKYYDALIEALKEETTVFERIMD